MRVHWTTETKEKTTELWQENENIYSIPSKCHYMLRVKAAGCDPWLFWNNHTQQLEFLLDLQSCLWPDYDHYWPLEFVIGTSLETLFLCGLSSFCSFQLVFRFVTSFNQPLLVYVPTGTNLLLSLVLSQPNLKWSKAFQFKLLCVQAALSLLKLAAQMLHL